MRAASAPPSSPPAPALPAGGALPMPSPAAAFLALSDPGGPLARPRRAPAAAAAALALAVALALFVSGAGAVLGLGDDRTAATLPGKAWPADVDEDDAGPGAG